MNNQAQSVSAHFSSSYAQARERFLGAAQAAGLPVQSHRHPLRGRDGEDLAMDVARVGADDAQALLIVSSACHGVEGYCGSGVQVAALRDGAWLARTRASGVAVLLVHALNPYGFSYIRRVTNENVDLNRNFHDFSQPLPTNEAYRELHPLLLPEVWPPATENVAAIDHYIRTHGPKAWQSAITRGQHEFPGGVFFGGTAPTWSNLTWRQVLREHDRGVRRIAWIDLHTGLGPSGLGERIFACPDDAAALRRAQAWWSGGGATPVTSIYDGSSSSAYLTGLMWSSVGQECPQAEYTGIALEYGTEPMAQVMQAMRAEHWLNLHPQAPAELAAQIRQQMLQAFYTDTDAWKTRIVQQAMEAMAQALEGLRG